MFIHTVNQHTNRISASEHITEKMAGTLISVTDVELKAIDHHTCFSDLEKYPCNGTLVYMYELNSSAGQFV